VGVVVVVRIVVVRVVERVVVVSLFVVEVEVVVVVEIGVVVVEIVGFDSFVEFDMFGSFVCFVLDSLSLSCKMVFVRRGIQVVFRFC